MKRTSKIDAVKVAWFVLMVTLLEARYRLIARARRKAAALWFNSETDPIQSEESRARARVLRKVIRRIERREVEP